MLGTNDYEQIRQIILEVLEEHEKRKSKRLYSIDEAAERLDVSRGTIYNLMKPNKRGDIQIRPVRIGRNLKIVGEELDRLTASSLVSGHIRLRPPVSTGTLLDQAA